MIYPGATAHDAECAVLGFPCGAIRRGILIVDMPAILGSFPDVAQHVVQAKGIGFFSPRLVRFAVRVLPEPGVLCQPGGIISKMKN